MTVQPQSLFGVDPPKGGDCLDTTLSRRTNCASGGHAHQSIHACFFVLPTKPRHYPFFIPWSHGRFFRRLFFSLFANLGGIV